MKKDTQCVHSGTYVDPETKGINTPIFTSSSFEYLDRPENVYPRYFNTLNQKTVIDKLCALENAEDGLIFSSGMAAISTVIFSLLKSGDHIVLQRDIYGGTHHFATADFDRFGIEYSFVSGNLAEIEDAIRDNTRIVYIESPSNPLLVITDIAAVAQVAKSKNILTAIDNTFASPINQNPLDYGIDFVIHSGTKYIGGHSDICCGAVLAAKNLIAKIKKFAANSGGNLNAMTCYLIERSLKTLALRVEKQNKNALEIARRLQTRIDDFFLDDKVEVIIDPALASKAIAGSSRIRLRSEERSRIRARTSRTWFGSRPRVGSSRITTRGRCTMAWAMPRRWR